VAQGMDFDFPSTDAATLPRDSNDCPFHPAESCELATDHWVCKPTRQ